MINIDSGYEIAVVKGEDKGRIIPLTQRELHLGRRSGEQDEHWIYFAEPTVSRHHATLVWDETRRHFTIYHKSRTNPTLVNGKPVQHSPLVHQDVVQVGLLVFRVQYVGTEQVRAAGKSAAGKSAAVVPPPDPRRQPELEDSEEQGLVQSGLRLTVTEGPDRGSLYELDKPVLFIGRREGLGDPRGANGILLNDDGLPKEQVLLAWNERERTYGIFQADTSRLPTRILRRSGGEYQTIHLDSLMQTLLRVDDIISMGETAMQVELSVEEAAAARPELETRETDLRERLRRGSVDPDDEATQIRRTATATARAFLDPTPPQRRPVEVEPARPAPPRAPAFQPAGPTLTDENDEAPVPVPRREIVEVPTAPPPVPPPASPEPPQNMSWVLPAEEIRFPTLDVNFVRNLPTRPPTRDSLSDSMRPLTPAPLPGDEDPFEMKPLERPGMFAGGPPPSARTAPTPPTPAPARPTPTAPPAMPQPRIAETSPGAAPGLPSHYRPPEFEEDDDEEPEATFGETFSWKYRADYIIGFLEGRNRGQKVELLTSHLEDGRKIPVGSKGERINEIEVDDPQVGNQQATITYQGGRFSMLNEADRTALYVNQIALNPGEEMLLKTGDRITMGETVLMFLERSVVQMLSKYELKVVAGISDDRGKTFDLLREVVIIGRNKGCDIALADPEVSRKHVAITLRGGRFYLTHLSASNPTFINGVSLPRGKDRILNEGDKVQLSDHTAVVFVPRGQPGKGKR